MFLLFIFTPFLKLKWKVYPNKVGVAYIFPFKYFHSNVSIMSIISVMEGLIFSFLVYFKVIIYYISLANNIFIVFYDIV